MSRREEHGMIRAFLAVEVTDALRSGLAQVQQDVRRLVSRDPAKTIRISWVQPSSMHLTIKFLGDMAESFIEPLRVAISQALDGERSLHIPIERLGVFPRLQQPRVVWAGPSDRWEQGEDAVRLALLHQSVEERCHALGFAQESRPLSPHLTLARIKEGEREVGRLLAQSGALDHLLAIGSLDMQSIVLMKSELRPTGPIYTPLWKVNFGG